MCHGMNGEQGKGESLTFDVVSESGAVKDCELIAE
jgi:hypothetical protein